MMAAEIEEQIKALFERSGVTSLFLDTGFNRDVVEQILGVNSKFDTLVGDNWDIIVPSVPDVGDGDAYYPGRESKNNFNFSNYNEELARKNLVELGISENDCPCLVFFGYDESDFLVYPVASIRERWSDEFFALAKVIDVALKEHGHLEGSDRKAALMRSVRDYLRPRMRFERVKRTSGLLATALGFASGLVTMGRI